MRILIAEDNELKFEDLIAALGALSPAVEPVRAKTIVEVEDWLEKGEWDLVLLDISMDIAPGAAGPLRDGHASLGGMDVLERMFLLRSEYPTIIVTGFDYFVAPGPDSSIREAQTLADLEIKARGLIGDHLLGCVRYGAQDWRSRLISLLPRSGQ